MSHRSLRIDDCLLDRSLPHSTASFNIEGRKNRSLSSRRLSSSCSEAILPQTPRRMVLSSSSRNSSLLNSSGVHSVAASDASLLSLLLDESNIQESTIVDGFWGLDLDIDHKETSMMCESTILPNCTLIGPDTSCLKPELHCMKHGKLHCDCDPTTDSKTSSESSCSSSWPLRPKPALGPDPASQSSEEMPTVYSRGRKHKGQYCIATMKESRDPHINWMSCGAAARAFWWIWRKCSQMNKDHKGRFPLGFVLFLFLLFAIVFSALWCGLAVTHFMDSDLPFPRTLTSQSLGESLDPGSAQSSDVGPTETHSTDPGSGPTQWIAVQTSKEPEIEEFSHLDASRLEHLEQSLSLLWRQMEAGGGVCAGVDKDQDSDQSSVLKQQLDLIRIRLEQDQRLWEQIREREVQQQQNLSFQLEQLQQHLDELSKRTLDLELKRDATQRDFPDSVPAPLGSGTKSQDVVLSELSRLQAALQSVRQELQTLSDCRGTCSKIHDLQDTVSFLVQEGVWNLVFGSELQSEVKFGSKTLVQVLSEQFVSEQSLQGALSALESRILQQRIEERPLGGAVTQQDVHTIVNSALRLFSEDRTGLADYALESGGGSIVSTRCSQTFETKAALLSLFGIPLWYFSQSPRTVIQPDVHPGNCWAFRGSIGVLVIRLSSRILPSGFTLEHIPRSLSPFGNLQSAPKQFSVYGLRNEAQEEGILLGTYLYDKDGDALQTFRVIEDNHESFHLVLVRVLSNWGHKDYTCLYRFRVHGSPVQDQTETKAETQEKGETETESETEAEDQNGFPTENEAETNPDSEAQTEPETLSKTRSEEETLEGEEETEIESEADDQTGTQTETGAESEPETDVGSEPGQDQDQEETLEDRQDHD